MVVSGNGVCVIEAIPETKPPSDSKFCSDAGAVIAEVSAKTLVTPKFSKNEPVEVGAGTLSDVIVSRRRLQSHLKRTGDVANGIHMSVSRFLILSVHLHATS